MLANYESKGFEFLLSVFNQPSSFLEDLTGLTLLHQQSHEVDVWELSDDDDADVDDSM